MWIGGCAQMSSDGAHVQQPTTQSKIVLIPNSVDFSDVAVGQKNSQTLKLSNSGTTNAQITSIAVTGAGLSITGVTLPFSLAPQASETFNVEFAPKSTGSVTGTLSIESAGVSQNFNVKGAGTKAQAKLQTDPVSIDFGKLAVKNTSQRKVTITNTGNARCTITKVSLSGTGFSISGVPSQLVLDPQQTASFEVTFKPQAKGATKGSIGFVSKDLSAAPAISLAGDAVDAGSVPAASHHSVKLEWDAAPGNPAGYNVYRGEQNGGPYDKLTSSSAKSTNFTDTDVQSGQKYYYVVTSVNRGGHESKHSDQVSVTIPTP
jgi:P pilus assembly chaperone PapD